MNPAEFLTARLDEDEAMAKAAWGVEWDWRYVAQPFGERPSIAHTVHIARHDPARVLREVEAKREILTAYIKAEADGHRGNGWIALRFAVEALTAAWSDHGDYRPGWKP